MAQKVTLKRSNVQGKVPTTADVDLGEIAINTYDGKVFFKKDNGTESIIDILEDAGQLQKITEGGNTGWRLLDRNPDNYGDIGQDAIDFSNSLASSTTAGATGTSSFAEGVGVQASGLGSHAEGDHTVAPNDYMHAAGKFNIGTSTDTIHETGIGIDDANRKNAFEIYTDGKIYAPELTTTLINDAGTSNKVLITKEWVSDTLADYQLTSEKGQANGYAELDSNGSVPSAQLPSYVDDVLEYADFASLPTTGETGKIYVTTDDNKTYRWSGTAYVEISASLALGETSSTAYRGDRGKIAYDHSQATGNPHNATTDDITEGSTNLYWTQTRFNTAFATKTIDGLSDVDTSTTSPSTGDYLKWDGSDWVPSTPSISITENQFTATSGQTAFVVSGTIFTESEMESFTNSLRDRKTSYDVSDNGTDTTVTFSSGKNSGDLVDIMVYTIG